MRERRARDEELWERHPDGWCGLTLAWCLDYLGRREEAIRWYARVAARPFLTETQRRAVAAGVEAPQTPKAPPAPPKGLVEVANTGWSATASHEDPPATWAVDGDTRTRWTLMGEGQRPGMWLRIDLGQEIEGLAGVWLDDDAGGLSFYRNDAPRHCVVSVSRDGEWWKRVGDWRWQPNQSMEAWWEPVSVRYVMLEQTEYGSPEWWSVYEVHAFHAR